MGQYRGLIQEEESYILEMTKGCFLLFAYTNLILNTFSRKESVSKKYFIASSSDGCLKIS